jgi:D-sedoheptulose 7-phosphate isomerase
LETTKNIHLSHPSRIKTIIEESIALKQSVLNDVDLLLSIEEITELIIKAYRSHKKVLLCGNGGSAADAQHIAAELSGRFYLNRKPLYAEALHVNTSYLTATANDFGFDFVYSRLVEAMGNEGDILIAISTSGNSDNVVNALKAAKAKNMITVGLTGKSGGKMNEFSDVLLCIPSTDTPRIQEEHITIGHIVCELVESALFKK